MKWKSDIKVGLFVMLGLVLAALVVFLIGEERRVFDRAHVFYATFDDVAGLKSGAPVEMGGVRIGQVKEVAYKNPDDPKVYVTFSVVAEEAKRIHDDSRVTIVPKGMLGDRMVTVTRGTSGTLVAEGELIPSDEPGDLFGRIDAMASKADATMGNISVLAEQLADEQLHRDIRDSARGLNVLLTEITTGNGYPHKLLTDEKEAERISRVVANLDQTTLELAATLREVRLVTTQVRAGPGFAHDVIYGEGPAPQIAQFGRAADEVAVTLKAIREGDGLARDLLFGGKGDTKDAISNVTQLTADLRDIVHNMKQGKGTIGALLVDPSIYEDLKRVLGNVERNSILRALVRYSIKRDEKPPKNKVADQDR
jgi:phospholipid/cholesterol/gamma-HCH transport system substrate-binding protein